METTSRPGTFERVYVTHRDNMATASPGTRKILAEVYNRVKDVSGPHRFVVSGCSNTYSPLSALECQVSNT